MGQLSAMGCERWAVAEVRDWCMDIEQSTR